ncbi:unnamed protein product [Rhizophagus irregularis]|nr:unnamed protein product [Rhizophagus irregularis]CAB5381660.1 unnamed protein product [Rhizophagus irregularis]
MKNFKQWRVKISVGICRWIWSMNSVDFEILNLVFSVLMKLDFTFHYFFLILDGQFSGLGCVKFSGFDIFFSSLGHGIPVILRLSTWDNDMRSRIFSSL